MDYGYATHIGRKRSINQDAVYAALLEKAPGESGIFVVADGMGGHSAGEKASQIAARTLMECFSCEQLSQILQSPKEHLLQAVLRANQIIQEISEKDPQLAGMGTTLVAALVQTDRVLLANVGDSRAYLYQERLKQLTTDNSYVQELLERGVIDQEQAKHHPRKNIITRAVGVEPKLDVDFYQIERQPGSVLLLCSDGLSNMVKEERIVDIVERYKEQNLTRVCQALVEEANAQGGHDNISVICVAL